MFIYFFSIRFLALYAEMKEGPLKDSSEFGSKQLRDDLKREYGAQRLVKHI
jgi:hypothetical protein